MKWIVVPRDMVRLPTFIPTVILTQLLLLFHTAFSSVRGDRLVVREKALLPGDMNRNVELEAAGNMSTCCSLPGEVLTSGEGNPEWMLGQ
jgi:hypothetical protein